MYAMVCTRPDIAHAVGVVSRFMSNPGREHWEAVKWILRYLRGSLTSALVFRKSELGLQGYVDADNGGDVDSRKSTSGYVYTFGGTAISWVSRLQKIVALSSCEAEYVAITEATKEMIWLQTFLGELGQDHEWSVLYSDSQSVIQLKRWSTFFTYSSCESSMLSLVLLILIPRICFAAPRSFIANSSDNLFFSLSISCRSASTISMSST